MRRLHTSVAVSCATVALAAANGSIILPRRTANNATTTSALSSSSVLTQPVRAFRIVRLGEDTPEEIAAAKKAAVTSSKRRMLPDPDSTLTNFPDGVGTCMVFRNIMSSDQEQLIWEELTPVMKQDGTMHFAEASKVDDKKLRNIYLEMFGMKPYTDVKNWKKQETKQVPGFVWAPTLVKWLQAAGPEIEAWINHKNRLTPIPVCPDGACAFASGGGLGGDGVGDNISKRSITSGKGAMNPNGLLNNPQVLGTPAIKTGDAAKEAAKKGEEDPITGPVEWLDMGRVVEHTEPGYEMHIEHPTTGRYFIYLNLLSETVLTFDDEATGRVGKVLLPQRSLMICSSELRWGWRMGEHSQKTQTYQKEIVRPDGTAATFSRRVSPDIRLSIQLWKYETKLADRRHLQAQVENSVRTSLGGDLYEGYDAASESGNGVSSATGGDGSSGGGMFGGDAGGAFKINAFNLGGDGANNATQIKRGGVSSKALDMTAATAPDLNNDSNAVGLGKLGGDFIPQNERDAAAKNNNQQGSSSSSAGNGNTTAPAVPKTMDAVDKDFGKYKDAFSRLTTLMSDMKNREDAGMKVSDEWLKEKMDFKSDGDEYGFDPVNPEKTWESMENRARFYRDKIKSMDYDGTNEIGKPKKKSAAKTKPSANNDDGRNDPLTQREARNTMDAEIEIEGLEKKETPAQRQKRLDDDEEGDGVDLNGVFEGFGTTNRSPADMRRAMEKLMPKDKADRMLNSMPKSFGQGAGRMGGMGGGMGMGGASGQTVNMGGSFGGGM